MDHVRAQLSARVRGAAAAFLAAAAWAFSMACGKPPDPAADPVRPPGYIIDSIHPPEELLRRFRVGLEPVTALDGPGSRAELFQRFDSAVTRRDSVALDALVINRAEFGWLIFPESKLSRPPYRQPPEIAWLHLRLPTESGLRRLLARGQGMVLMGHTCPDTTSQEGRMRVTTGCTSRVRYEGSVRNMQLYGRVVELGGRWKFIGLDGDL